MDPTITRAAYPDLSVVELSTFRGLLAADRYRLAPEASKAQAQFMDQQAKRIVARARTSFAAAMRIVQCHLGGVLLPLVLLPFDDDEFNGVTVGDVLADPDRFVGATLSDPLEGPKYGRCKAKIMRRTDGTLWIHSFAHGRTIYELKYDAQSIEAAIRTAALSEVLELFIRLLLMSELSAGEEQGLRDLVTKLSGVKARPLTAHPAHPSRCSAFCRDVISMETHYLPSKSLSSASQTGWKVAQDARSGARAGPPAIPGIAGHALRVAAPRGPELLRRGSAACARRPDKHDVCDEPD